MDRKNVLVVKLGKIKKDNPYLKTPKPNSSKEKLNEQILKAHNTTAWALNVAQDNLQKISSVCDESYCFNFYNEYMELHNLLAKITHQVINLRRENSLVYSEAVLILKQLKMIDICTCDFNDKMIHFVRDNN